MVAKTESLSVAGLKRHSNVTATQAANCFGDQSLTEVNSGHETVRRDLGGEVEGVGPRAAADIQDSRPRLKAESVYKRRFPVDDTWEFVGLIEETQKETWIGCVVNAR